MRSLFACPLLCLSALSFAQTSLTVEDALKLAAERNGDVRSAILSAKAAKERTTQSFSSFLPTASPSYQYVDQRQSVVLPSGTFVQTTKTGTTSLNFNWEVLDSGERNFRFLSSRRAEESAYLSSIQTLRQTLFTVFQDYASALSADATLKVNQSAVERAQGIYDQTRARVKAGDTAGIDALQAKADAMNAEVTALTSEQGKDTSYATLKGIIGWTQDTPFPNLADLPDPSTDEPPALADLIKSGVELRPDLRSQRLNLESLRYNKRLLERQAGFTFSVQTGFAENFSPSASSNQLFSLSFKHPGFDGGLSRAQAREAAFNLESAEASYVQTERSAKADIESARAQLVTNLKRLGAAKAAQEAADINYKSAVEAQRLGANTVIEVLTARVSLATAESNAISARYDTLISQVRLALVTGRPIPGAPQL